MQFKKAYIIHNDHDVPYHLVCRALKRINSTEIRGEHIVDFSKIVGYSNLVEVVDGDVFYEEARGNRPYVSRFVKNKLPIPCSKLAIVWQRKNENLIYVITAYFTDRDTIYCPDEPGNIIRKFHKGIPYTKEQIEASLEFWSKYAFVEPIPFEFL